LIKSYQGGNAVYGLFTKDGSGNLTLGQSQNHKLGLDIKGGTLTTSNSGIGANNANTTTLIVVRNGATFEFTETMLFVGGKYLEVGTGGGIVKVSPGKTLTMGHIATGHFNDSKIVGTGSMTKTGGGTLVSINANTYTGATIISEGTLQLGDGTNTTAALSTSSAITNNANLAFNRVIYE
jgi:autotransporter-associated beta strand protein